MNYRRATEHACFALLHTAIAILYFSMVVWGCVGLIRLGVVHL